MTVFQIWTKSVQVGMEQALADYLPDVSVSPAHLHEGMRYAALDGGKRVRPLLVYAAGRLFDAHPAVLARAAAAVEMIHVYSLVHDDMPCMDDDALRRGKATVHVKYDDATALLVGDALQAQAFLILSEAPAAPETVVALLRVLAQASGSVGMCGGQAIDLASVGVALTREQLQNMHEKKTGALLQASVLMGALSGKTLIQSETEALKLYSAAIGLAFQVVDDVLDATADSATLGKTAGKDAMDNKPTYVSLLGLDASLALAEQLRTQAHDALSAFGERAQYLRDLADLIVRRSA